MLFAYIRAHLERTIELGPSWMRWLESASPTANEAARRERRLYWRFRLPLTISVICIYAASKEVGMLQMHWRIGTWLLTLAVAPMLWPPHSVHLGSAAYRGIRESPPEFRNRLRAFAFLSFAVAVISSVLLAGFIAIACWATLGMP